MKIEQSAVEWLLEQMDVDTSWVKEEVEQAKEMEKEQKIEFAKIHVKSALKAVEDKIIVRGYAGLIMNSYPLENIK